MSTESDQIIVGGLTVSIVRKDIKNLHLAVYPPDGRVRIAVPHRIDNDAIRLAVVSRLGWIRRQQTVFARQPRQSAREMVSGESFFVEGSRFRLEVNETSNRPQVRFRNNSTLELRVRPDSNRETREVLVNRWLRNRLRAEIPDMIAKWEPIIGVRVESWGIRQMKTRWGSCNVGANRIWINFELAKKPRQCLEYIIVHEMVHLLERTHGERFQSLMDKFLPRWRKHRDTLNQLPLRHEDWAY